MRIAQSAIRGEENPAAVGEERGGEKKGERGGFFAHF